MGNTLMGCLYKGGYKGTILDSDGNTDDIIEELGRNNYAMVIATNTGMSPSQIQDIVPAIKIQSPDAFILVLSGVSNRRFVSDLKRKGVDGCLPLPFEEAALMNRVDELLARQTP